jgi:hydrogenase nickel incorporation protein HypB
VTEGPYMVMKHPMIFMGADLVIINKIDLAGAMGVDVNKLRNDVFKINPKATVISTSFKMGQGVKEVAQKLGLS